MEKLYVKSYTEKVTFEFCPASESTARGPLVTGLRREPRSTSHCQGDNNYNIAIFPAKVTK